MFRFTFLVSLLLSSILMTSCTGVVYPVPLVDTIHGAAQAVRGAPGTWVYINPASDIIVLGWCQGTQQAFLLVDRMGHSVTMDRITQAQKVSWKAAADFLSWLEYSGWQSVSVGMLPPALVSTISQTNFLLGMTPIIILLPLSLIPEEPLDLLRSRISS